MLTFFAESPPTDIKGFFVKIKDKRENIIIILNPIIYRALIIFDCWEVLNDSYYLCNGTNQNWIILKRIVRLKRFEFLHNIHNLSQCLLYIFCGIWNITKFFISFNNVFENMIAIKIFKKILLN